MVKICVILAIVLFVVGFLSTFVFRNPTLGVYLGMAGFSSFVIGLILDHLPIFSKEKQIKRGKVK